MSLGRHSPRGNFDGGAVYPVSMTQRTRSHPEYRYICRSRLSRDKGLSRNFDHQISSDYETCFT
jgi:hypothetical protein